MSERKKNLISERNLTILIFTADFLWIYFRHDYPFSLNIILGIINIAGIIYAAEKGYYTWIRNWFWTEHK